MLQIKTTKIQELASKAAKGVGNNKSRAITEKIAIRVKDNTLTIITTDFDNYLYVSESVESDDFYAVVQADQFLKLITRLTSDMVSFEVSDNCLEIKGNGSYRIPLTIDENTGVVVEYPDPVSAFESTEENKVGEITINDIKTILRAVKPALATTVAIPQYENYFVGNMVLATDTNTANCYGRQITNVSILVSATTMDLLDGYTGDTPLSIHKIDDKLVFIGDAYVVYGYAMPGVESFAVDKLDAYLNTEYPSKCKIAKTELLQAIDRLSIFVGDFDEDTVSIAFTEQGLQMASQKSDSVETIPYIESESLTELNSHIYLELFRSQVKAQTGDSIDLYFGEPKSIKLIDSANNTISVVCLVKI